MLKNIVSTNSEKAATLIACKRNKNQQKNHMLAFPSKLPQMISAMNISCATKEVNEGLLKNLLLFPQWCKIC